MNKKPKQPPADTLSDEQLFQQAVEGVVPLKTAIRTESKAPRSRLRVNPGFENVESMQDNYLDELDGNREGSSDTDGTHRKNGVKKQTLQRLVRGQFPPEDQFDLHHLNTYTGKIEILNFIAWSQQRGLRCVRIIHGKGLRSEQEPKLKLMARQVLREHAKVMAFTACKPAHGGDGATDVLLKT